MSALAEKNRFWADVVLECNRRDHTNTLSAGNQRGPFRSARVLGMALAALHDGYALATAGTRLLTTAVGAVPAAADKYMVAAAACHEVLVRRYPLLAWYLDAAWRDWIEMTSSQALAGSPSETFGRALGTSILAIGIDDPIHATANTYTPSHKPYTHDRPANDPNQGFAGSSWGHATRLLAAHVTGFPKPPGRIDDETVDPDTHYKSDFDRTVLKGVLDRHTGVQVNARTLVEETTGIFWGYDGPQEIGTPPRLYMQVVLAVLDNIDAGNAVALSEYDELRIVAAVAVAIADAGIDAWHYKYSPDHMMWRPCLGIPQAAGGNGGAAKALWQPLGRPDTNGTGVGLTPDFPSYPSGHATFGAAAFQLLRLMLVDKTVAAFDPTTGLDNVRFDFMSDEYNGRNADARTRQPRDIIVRGYTSLWSAVVENSLSRVYLGVHWQFDGVTIKASGNKDTLGEPASPSQLGKTGGVWLGCQVANQIAAKVGIAPATIAGSKAT